MAVRSFLTPREPDLDLRMVASPSGMVIRLLPNGGLFSLEYQENDRRILVNQLLGSPLDGGIGRLLLRAAAMAPDAESLITTAAGAGNDLSIGIAADRVVWDGITHGIRHRVSLILAADRPLWFWRVDLVNEGTAPVTLDALLIQDLGLGDRGFLMNNEAYVSQYLDHLPVDDPELGWVLMSRQNLDQGGQHRWALHACLDRAVAFATDGAELFGPGWRDGSDRPLARPLPSRRLQQELAAAALTSAPVTLAPGASRTITFVGLFQPDHPAASAAADLRLITPVPVVPSNISVVTAPARATLPLSVEPVMAEALTEMEIERLWPRRRQEERSQSGLQSFFTGEGIDQRHVALRDKERALVRRHGTILRTGSAMLPDEATLSVTCWAHGVLGAQLSVGNTSFHKLFSVVREPFGITRSSGLRLMVDTGDGWQLLTVPSAFEMGLSDVRWLYQVPGRRILVTAVASGADPAMRWTVTVEGAACRFLVYGHLALGEREYDTAARVTIDEDARRASFRPDPDWLWGQHYPDAVYHLVTGTPAEIGRFGGDELLYQDGRPRGGAYIAFETVPTTGFDFAVVGSMTDAAEAEAWARRFEAAPADVALLGPARDFWSRLMGDALPAVRTDAPEPLVMSLPWLAHNALVHLTAPHGLEQYTGAAWGTRDVAQGPVEGLLALGHHAEVREILLRLFAEQSLTQGDWPQWFMLPPYSVIRDSHSHGDVIVWPLKAVNDYLEATGDVSLFDETVPWWDVTVGRHTPATDTLAVHLDRLIATVESQFVPGTSLIRYGGGDWNDSLQPADPALGARMVSAWTVALLQQQLARHAVILKRAGREERARHVADLAETMKADFRRLLMPGGVVTGYAVFDEGRVRELLLHPSDTRTGIRYSVLPITQALVAGLLTPDEIAAHLAIVHQHLQFPDGIRLMDRPVPYHGGPETLFRRAESASNFGREIGLMYVHAHLRWAEALASRGDSAGLLDSLLRVNPIGVNAHVPNASPRQRNVYFSSSDAAFRDRLQASAEWSRVHAGTIACDGGWRLYSSGPGIMIGLILKHVLARGG